MSIEVRRLTPSDEADFLGLTGSQICGGCHCVAWWVDDWERGSSRTSDQNRLLRQELFERGEHDGYLAYVRGEPVGWCQVGPRDRLKKLAGQFQLTPDPFAWAVTCFVVLPEHRRRGVATSLLTHVLSDLPARGARSLEAFPRHGNVEEAPELWNGPPALFAGAGFTEIGRDDRRVVLRCTIEEAKAN